MFPITNEFTRLSQLRDFEAKQNAQIEHETEKFWGVINDLQASTSKIHREIRPIRKINNLVINVKESLEYIIDLICHALNGLVSKARKASSVFLSILPLIIFAFVSYQAYSLSMRTITLGVRQL